MTPKTQKSPRSKKRSSQEVVFPPHLDGRSYLARHWQEMLPSHRAQELFRGLVKWDPLEHFIFATADFQPVLVPRVLRDLTQVPESVRDDFIFEAEAFGWGGLATGRWRRDPNPWYDLKAPLWSDDFTTRVANSRRAAFRSKEAIMVALAGVGDQWRTLRTMIEGGSRDPFTLLGVAMSSGVNARQLVVLQQLLNEVLPCWAEEDLLAGAGPELPWTLGLASHADWEADRIWGEVRSACAKKGAARQKALSSVLRYLEHRACPRMTSGHYLRPWMQLREDVLAYANSRADASEALPEEEAQEWPAHLILEEAP